LNAQEIKELIGADVIASIGSRRGKVVGYHETKDVLTVTIQVPIRLSLDGEVVDDRFTPTEFVFAFRKE
jgi:hypothetical protein